MSADKTGMSVTDPWILYCYTVAYTGICFIFGGLRQEFFSGGGGLKKLSFGQKFIENGDMGALAP
jgi:hypothetical protein